MEDRATIDASPVRLALRIEGRVQGVGFRAWMAREARLRGLAGWVRNLPDGAVQALFVGPAAGVASMRDACGTGPPHARVTGCIEIPSPRTGADATPGSASLPDATEAVAPGTDFLILR